MRTELPSQRRIGRLAYSLAALIACSVASPHVWAMCGEPFERNAFKRPIDYLAPSDKEYVTVWVEPFHFTKEVESLIRGKTAEDPVGDLAYTLRQIPNHHRALNSMMLYQLHRGRPRDADERLIYPMECYFERALAIHDDDAVVLMLQGVYFHRLKQYDDAARSYQKAEAFAPNAAELQYNMGLLEVDRHNYDAATKHAIKAYQLGYPMPGLRKKLAEAGHPLS
jgi:tetratricopeptide (TPR) repeat protein